MTTAPLKRKAVTFLLSKKNRHRGFTFVELLVVLTCIIAMGTGAFYVAGQAMNYSRYSTARADVATISTAVSQYYFEVGSMPANLDALTFKSGGKSTSTSDDVSLSSSYQ